jgi:hypothetical protein
VTADEEEKYSGNRGGKEWMRNRTRKEQLGPNQRNKTAPSANKRFGVRERKKERESTEGGWLIWPKVCFHEL